MKKKQNSTDSIGTCIGKYAFICSNYYSKDIEKW